MALKSKVMREEINMGTDNPVIKFINDLASVPKGEEKLLCRLYRKMQNDIDDLGQMMDAIQEELERRGHPQLDKDTDESKAELVRLMRELS